MIAKIEEELFSILDSDYKDLMATIEKSKLSDDIIEKMHEVSKKVIERFKSEMK